jgi:predicted transcriptional regulator
MQSVRVRDVMIPIAHYVTVKREHTLIEVIQALEEARQSRSGRAHRDALVVDDTGRFIGKVTMIDIFRSLEPNYKRVEEQQRNGVLTRDFVMRGIRDLGLWMEPLKDLCTRGGRQRVAEVMHVPDKYEYIKEDESLDAALHRYVMGVHQPLLVTQGETVTGALRFGDVFEVIRERMLKCLWEPGDAPAGRKPAP